jgi:hypothetical protein
LKKTISPPLLVQNDEWVEDEKEYIDDQMEID